VEGDSAGRFLRQKLAVTARTQAILPLKGKYPERRACTFDRMLGSQEDGNLVMALGTGYGRDEFNIDKLPLPQDVHQRDLRTSTAAQHPHAAAHVLSIRQMPKLIENGHLYYCAAALVQSVARQV